MLYVALDATGWARHLHYAPYLDYRPLRVEELGVDVLLSRPETVDYPRFGAECLSSFSDIFGHSAQAGCNSECFVSCILDLAGETR